jgi:hypothetical protein
MSIFHNNILAGAAGSSGGGFTIERSLRFTNHHSSYLSRTYGSGNNRKFTVSAWVKRTPSNSSEAVILGCRDDDSNRDWFGFESDELVAHHRVNGTTRSAKVTDRKFRDFSAWYHIVYAFNSTLSNQNDRTKFYVNGERQTVSTYNGAIGSNENVTMNLQNKPHYIGVQNLYQGGFTDFNLAEVHFIDNQELDADDFGEYDDNNVWQPKEYSGTYGTTGWYLDFSDNSSNSALGTDSSGNNNNWNVYNLQGPGPSSYPEGSVSIPNGYPSENTDWPNIWNGAYSSYPGDFLTAHDGRVITINWSTGISNVTKIRYYSYNGSDRHKVNSGSWSGNSGSGQGWKTAYSGSAITLTKLELQKADGVSYVKIGAIEINDEIVSESIQSDNLIDTPTDYEAASGNNGGNYCTLNPLQNSGVTLRNGCLDIIGTNNGWKGAAGTFGMSSGKWYFEYDNVTSNEHLLGIVHFTQHQLHSVSSYAYGAETGGKYTPSTSNVSYGSSWTTGDVIGVAFDADNGSLTFYKNGTSQGTAFTGLTDGPYLPSVVLNGTSRKASLNFGQRPFKHTPPSGYKSLCTANLTDPTIEDPSTVFDVITYTGDGNSTKTISGLSFTPDIIWHKRRNNSHYHRLFDTARGVSNSLFPSEQFKQNHVTDYGYLTGTSSTGFTVAQGTHSQNLINVNNGTYVNWCWGTGSSSYSTLTSGSISSGVRRNQNAGFSIVTWTGNGQNATIGHGLNAVPELIIIKDRDTSRDWYVGSSYLTGSPWLKYMSLNNSNSANSNSDIFQQGGQPTSSVFGVGQVGNASGSNIAYCFTSVPGFSLIGSYTATGNTNDGPMVFCGFTPRFLIVKNMTGQNAWFMWDTARREYNVNQKVLRADTEGTESDHAEYAIDFLSNGFKVRANANSNVNGSNTDYLFMAFAENPFKVARAR